MAGSSGPVVGTICTMPVSTFSFGVAAATSSTPGIASMSAAQPVQHLDRVVGLDDPTVMISGPL